MAKKTIEDIKREIFGIHYQPPKPPKPKDIQKEVEDLKNQVLALFRENEELKKQLAKYKTTSKPPKKTWQKYLNL
jgi:succinate dehydrogenase/fumarate reductase flavoprotein subunit